MARKLISASVNVTYVLVLGSIFGSKANRNSVGVFESEEEARVFYINELAPERYGDKGPNLDDCASNHIPDSKMYFKYFKKGGPLELMTPIETDDWKTPNSSGCGLHICYSNLIDVVVKGDDATPEPLDSKTEIAYSMELKKEK